MKDKSAEYEQNNGWSNHRFAPLMPSFKSAMRKLNAEVTIGRTVAHIKKNKKILKLYPHYKGRSNDTLTLVDENKNVLLDFSLTISFDELILTIKSNLS
jgi:hypothetical protein